MPGGVRMENKIGYSSRCRPVAMTVLTSRHFPAGTFLGVSTHALPLTCSVKVGPTGTCVCSLA
jgi:hypothetical protein